MAIVLARVDSRLFHGQILEGWIPVTGTSMVIVADDSAASSPLQKRVMEMAAPDDIKIKVESIDDAVADMKSDTCARERVMLIFHSLHDAFNACKKGIKLDSINLGNVSYSRGRRQVTPSIALNDKDVEDLKAISEMGVLVDVRVVPGEKPKGVEELLEIYFDSSRRKV